MAGHKPFSDLMEAFTPERRARVASKAAVLLEARAQEEPGEVPSLRDNRRRDRGQPSGDA
jgi:hypothetical protein